MSYPLARQTRPLRVLHIVANYPDGVFVQPTTRAVPNLIEVTADGMSHFVVSIARVLPFGTSTEVHRGNTLSLSYTGLPLLLGCRFTFSRLATRITECLERLELKFDVVHAHKLSVEGLAGEFVATHFALPLVCTIRGYTDVRLLRLRPDLHVRFARILGTAQRIFAPAPWVVDATCRYPKVASRAALERKLVLLPNVVKNVTHSLPPAAGGEENRFVTIFRAGQGRDKGFPLLVDGLKNAVSRGRQVHLDVIGCDSDSAEGRLVETANLHGTVSFLGRLDNKETLSRLPGYKALLMPSRRETFGMVYLEALLSGVPIMYSAGTGIDGYFDGDNIGVRVDPEDGESVAAGVLELCDRGANFRAELARLLACGRFAMFSTDAIAKTYRDALEGAAFAVASNPRAA